ncbi:MAG: preprotein translocase subunit YajC, partial [Acidimicrobiales bacterium]
MNSLILLPILAVVFYLLLIRPQQRRASQQKRLLSELSVGEEVVTAGGVFGTVTALDLERMWLEVAPGVTIVFLRQSLARRLTERDSPPAGVDPDDMVSEWDPGGAVGGPEPATESVPGLGDRPAPEAPGDPAGGPERHQAALEDPTEAVGSPGSAERQIPNGQARQAQPPAPKEGESESPPGAAPGGAGPGGAAPDETPPDETPPSGAAPG